MNALRASLSALIGLIFCFLEGVGSPESGQELTLADVLGLFGTKAFKEHLHGFVSQLDHANNGLLELFERDCVRIVGINEIEALRNGLVVLHKVVSEALEKPAFPLRGVLNVLEIELLLDSFKSSVNLLVVELIILVVSESKDGCDQRLFMGV